MTANGSIDDFLNDLLPFFYGKSLTYVDVGAYVGKVFRKVVASGLKVREAHLIEPHPTSVASLRGVVAEQATPTCSVHVYALALGAEAGTARLRAAHSMTRLVDVDEMADAGDHLEVPCRTLDQLAPEFTDRRVSLLKIDAEGSELRILAGAAELLRDERVDVIYIEAGMNPEGTQQCFHRDIDEQLRSYGYRLFRIYEQMHEWPEDSPLLRRVNLAYFSRRFAVVHPFGLVSEMLRAQKRLVAAEADVAAERKRSTEATRAKEAETAQGQQAQAELRLVEASNLELERRLRSAERERDQLSERLQVVNVEHQRTLLAFEQDRAKVVALTSERARLLDEQVEASAERQRLLRRLQELEQESIGLRGVTSRLQEENASERRERAAAHERLLAELAARDASLLAAAQREEAEIASRLAMATRLDAAEFAHRETVAALRMELSSERERTSLLRSIELEPVRAELKSVSSERDLLRNQLNGLQVKHAESEQMSREVHKLYDASRVRERRARAEAAIASDKAIRTREHLSYRLGAALIEGSKSPVGWLRTPLELRRAYSQFQTERAGRTKPRSAPMVEALRGVGTSVALPMTADWQDVAVSAENGGELWVHPLSVTGGSVASLEMRIHPTAIASSLADLAGELQGALEGAQERSIKLRAGRSCLLFRFTDSGVIGVRLRKTRGEPCILRMELRPLREELTSFPRGRGETAAPLVGQAPPLVRPPSSKQAGNVLFEAFKLVRDGRGEAGLELALAQAGEAERRGISLIRALLVESDEVSWLAHINDYLRPLDIAPLELAPAGASRFLRLRAKTARQVMEGPLVSVIMPAFNAAATLELAAGSILAQTWRPLQLIIVDDASSDDTWALAQDLASRDARVTVLRNASNVGPYVSKNIALRLARGEYVTGHDADDWAHPERIEAHLKAMRSSPATRASLTGMLRMTASGALTRFAPRGPNTNDGALVAGFISCMFETRFLKDVLGGWDEVRFAGDSEIIQRAERVLGASLPRFPQLGMICLDAPEGLTNHPELGYSPLLGMSLPRREYRDSFKRWHERISAADCHLPFPQPRRLFDVPPALAVDRTALDASLNSHRLSGVLRGTDICDVCIVTDLRLPGGNASSTLDEVRYLRGQGLDVLLIHCPTVRTQGKPISNRYDEYTAICVPFHDIAAVRAKVLIVRHPAVAASPKFAQLAARIEARSAALIVNNSMRRSDGSSVYSPSELNENLSGLRCQDLRVFPLGPAIRRELPPCQRDVRQPPLEI